jgi:hypothetical protein
MSHIAEPRAKVVSMPMPDYRLTTIVCDSRLTRLPCLTLVPSQPRVLSTQI